MVQDEIRYPKPSGEKHANGAGVDGESVSSRLAAPIDRLASTVADMVLFLPIAAVLVAPFRRKALEAQLLGSQGTWTEAWVSAAFVAALALILYQTVCIYMWGATPGKRLLGLRVVPVWEKGRLRLWSAFWRSFVWTVELCCLGLPWIAVFGNERRRPIHDRIADTAVVVALGRKAFGPPSWREISMASGLTLGLLMSTSMVIASQLLRVKTTSPIEMASELEDEGALCSAVGDAQHDWIPDRGDEIPNRLEVGLALYASDQLEENCLAEEGEFEFWRGDSQAEAYLAKGLALDQDSHKRETYLSRVCEIAADSDACRAAQLMGSNKEDPKGDELQRDLMLGTVGAQSAVYLRLMAAQELLRTGEPAHAFEILNSIPQQKSLAYILLRKKSEALWRMDRKPEARSLFAMGEGVLAPDERLELSRWFCVSETDRDGCSTSASQECDVLGQVVDRFDVWLKKPEVASAYMRDLACESGVASPDRKAAIEKTMESLKDKLSDGSAKTLLMAVREKLDHNREAEMKNLSDVTAGAARESDDPMVYAALMRWLDLAVSPAELGDIRMAWERVSTESDEWSLLGQRLMDKASRVADWQAVYKVGSQLALHRALDRSSQAEMMAAADKMGVTLPMAGKTRIPASDGQ